MVILDANYGSQFSEIVPGTAVWVIDSEVNRPYVEAYWAQHPGRPHTEGVTLFAGEVASPERTLMGLLDTIAEHHPALLELEVRGCPLTPDLESYLIGENFGDFVRSSQGFVGKRAAPLPGVAESRIVG